MTAGRRDIAALGEVMVALRPVHGSLADSSALVPSVAGAEFNALAAAAAVGGRVTLVTRFGDDPFATVIRRAAHDRGVEVVAAVDAARPTGVFFAEASDDDRRTVHYYRAGSAASAMDASTAEQLLALDARSVLLSGLTAALGDGAAADALLHAAQRRPAGVRLVVDANLRPRLGLGRTTATLRELLPCTATFILGADEGEALFGTADPAAIISEARAAGAEEVVVKAGADGAYLLEGESLVRVPAVRTTVVDTVGAGDAFTGAYTVARGRGETAVHAVELAVAVAARVVASATDTGGLPAPTTRAELLTREDLTP